MQLNFTFAPPSKLVTSFFISGSIFYLISSFILFKIDILNLSYMDPSVIGFIHTFLVGFVMSIIFGAMYQLISVILEIPLASIELAYTHLGIFLVGITLFILSLIYPAIFDYIGYNSLILYISFLLYLINIFLSIKNVKKHEIKYYSILSAHIILFWGISAGLFSSIGLANSSFKIDIISMIHTHVGLVLFGFIFALIAIIATILLPMFMLSHNFNKKLSTYILYGVILSSISALFNLYFMTKLISFVTILLFCYQLYDIYTKRVRKHVDIYAKEMISSAIFLLSLALFIPFISSDKSFKLFGIFMSIGFLSSFVVGHIYKIVPFLVWNGKFAPLVGKQKVPMLADMIHEKYSNIEFYTKLLAIALLSIGLIANSITLITVGKILFIINSLLLLFNIIYIFKYKG